MRRNYSPFDGKRYLLNIGTNELHDLDNESTNCQINEINKFNIKMFDTIQEVKIHQIFASKPVNGCYWCLKNLDKG